MVPLVTRVLAPLALAFPAAAQVGSTFVVDDDGGPGVDFTDLPPAVAAAAAGDVLLVQPGVYSAFELTLGVRILGDGTPRVDGLVRVRDVPAGQVAALVGLDPDALHVESCLGAVLGQRLPDLAELRVTQSADVRFLDVDVEPPVGATTDAVVVEGSRVELAHSRAMGSSGVGWPGPYVEDQPGGTGLAVRAGARVHAIEVRAIGGTGAMTGAPRLGADPPFDASIGGTGLHVPSGGDVVMTRGLALGGYGGWAQLTTSCQWDAPSGTGAYVAGALRASQVVFDAPSYSFDFDCIEGTGTPLAVQDRGTFVEAVPPDPDLGAVGTPSAGALVQLVLRARPGDLAELHLGRRPHVAPDPATVVEDLVDGGRTVGLGAVPAGGLLRYDLRLPDVLPPGTLLVVQAELTRPGTGELLRTNSVPLVIR